ncbi:MAG: PKD domain-containing protein [Motilibacteraceae bacterium]
MWLFERTQQADGTLGPWEKQAESRCIALADPRTGVVGPAVLQPADVLTAFKKLPLPAGTLQVQPNGRILVNLDTIFSAKSTLPAAPYALTLLGHDVRVRAHEQTWTFDFGDGATLVSDTPGAPYPRRDITHDYTRKGSYQVSVQVTYTGEYSVDGGPWQDVPGTATVPGAPVPLQVLEARTQLVADPA